MACCPAGQACTALRRAGHDCRGHYYEVLGVPRDADTKAIKSAFRQLARRYHPDTSTEPDAEQRFKEIAEAYGVLSDPARRASYDAQGSAGLAGATAVDLWGGIDFADIFGSGAAVFGSLFERLFGPPAEDRQRGQDVHLDLGISVEEVLTGGTHEVTIGRPGPCPRCAGSGSRPGTAPRRCPGCGGTGRRAVASCHGPLMVRQVTACPRCAGRDGSSIGPARLVRPADGPCGRRRSPFASRPASRREPRCGWPQILITSAHYLSGGVHAWGWIMIILGAVQLLAAAGVWAANQLARCLLWPWSGSAPSARCSSSPPASHWSLVIIAADVVALWGLRALGNRENPGAA